MYITRFQHYDPCSGAVRPVRAFAERCGCLTVSHHPSISLTSSRDETCQWFAQKILILILLTEVYKEAIVGASDGLDRSLLDS